MLGQLSVEVTKDVNFVTNELEAVVHSVEDALLNHELLDVVSGAAKLSDRLIQPDLRLVKTNSAHLRHQDLDPVVEFLRRRLKLSLDGL